MTLRRLAGLGLLALTLIAPREGAASITGCAATTLGRVGNATACLFDTGYGNDSAAVVNRTPGTSAGYFGFKDWVMVNRDDAEGRSGSYAFDPEDAAGAGMFMLVFKSGSLNQAPSLIAYLVDSLAGLWQAPFTRDPFAAHPVQGRDVSHISYYVRGEAPFLPDTVPTGSTATVPEPAVLALFGLALTGLVLARRGRSARQGA